MRALAALSEGQYTPRRQGVGDTDRDGGEPAEMAEAFGDDGLLGPQLRGVVEMLPEASARKRRLRTVA